VNAGGRIDPEHLRKLERMYVGARTNEYYRPRIQIDEGVAEVAISVRPEFFHPFAVHGSVYFKLLDDAAFFAASSLVTDVFLLTVSFNLHLTRPVTEGEMIGRDEVVHRSRRLLIADAVVRDGEGRQLARGTGTFMPGTMKLDAAAGYV